MLCDKSTSMKQIDVYMSWLSLWCKNRMRFYRNQGEKADLFICENQVCDSHYFMKLCSGQKKRCYRSGIDIIEVIRYCFQVDAYADPSLYFEEKKKRSSGGYAIAYFAIIAGKTFSQLERAK